MTTQREIIQKTHDAVLELKTMLVGIPNTEDKGLVGEVKSVKLNVNELGKSHSKLKRNFYILVASLVVSGALGSGIYGLLSG